MIAFNRMMQKDSIICNGRIEFYTTDVKNKIDFFHLIRSSKIRFNLENFC